LESSFVELLARLTVIAMAIVATYTTLLTYKLLPRPEATAVAV